MRRGSEAVQRWLAAGACRTSRTPHSAARIVKRYAARVGLDPAAYVGDTRAAGS
jgi:hypothetical protein